MNNIPIPEVAGAKILHYKTSKQVTYGHTMVLHNECKMLGGIVSVPDGQIADGQLTMGLICN